MPTISEAIAQNKARIASAQQRSIALAQTPLQAAPTPPQDAPSGLGLPQRGMFPANVVLASDRSDSSRVFRGSGNRSGAFPNIYPSPNVSTSVISPAVSVTPTPSPAPSPSVLPSGLANQVLATPNGSSGIVSVRPLFNADFPLSGVTAGSYTNTNLTINAQGIITAATSGSSGGGGVVLQTSSYGAQNSDSGQIVSFNSVSPVTYTLQNAGVTTNWFVSVQNIGAGTLTISPNGLQIDGSSSSLSVPQNQGVFLYWNGSNYYSERGLVTGSGSGTVTTTGSPANGNLTKFSGPTSITNTNLTGDIATSGGSATTLATVNTNVGSFTNANITVNAKGLITAAANGTPGSAGSGTIVSAVNAQFPTTGRSNWQNDTVIARIPSTQLLSLANSFTVKMVFTAGSPVIGNMVIYKTNPGSTTVLSTTAVTISGVSNPTLTTPTLVTTDAISLTLDASHDWYFAIFFTNVVANASVSVNGNMTGGPQAGFASGDQTGVSTIPALTLTNANYLILGFYNP